MKCKGAVGWDFLKLCYDFCPFCGVHAPWCNDHLEDEE